jgi:hypothetical protein
MDRDEMSNSHLVPVNRIKKNNQSTSDLEFKTAFAVLLNNKIF